MSRQSLSEFDLIRRIRSMPQPFPPTVLRHIGDDAAAFDVSSSGILTVTSDLLLEGAHFRRHWMSPAFLGRKACLVNLSDLAAMGARPYACLLNLGLPSDLVDGYFECFIEKFLQECGNHGMPLVGGDFSESAIIVISVTAWGNCETGVPLCRSSARPGDRIILIGNVGYSRLGLEILKAEQPAELAEIRTEDELRTWAGTPERFLYLRAHFLPEVYVEPAVWIRQAGLANAMIDVSDGLASDLMHILEESSLSAQVEVEMLPRIAGVEDPDAMLEVSLNGGEDYALLFTASSEQVQMLRETYPGEFPRFHIIGSVDHGPAALYLRSGDGPLVEYEPRGFDHFQ